jgi:hypothetical protein
MGHAPRAELTTSAVRPAANLPLRKLIDAIDFKKQVRMFAVATATCIADKDSGRPGLIQALRSLGTLYPAHIWKEDYLLFPMATKVLSGEDDKVLLQQYATRLVASLGRG